MRQRTTWRTTAVAVLCLAGCAGCARTRAVTAPAPVALNVPPPPERVISTPPEPVTPTEAVSVERPPPASRPARNNRPAAPRNEPARPGDASRTEATADTAQAPSETAAPTGPLLRTPQTADETEAERRTKDVLDKARDLLNRLNPATLAQEARQQHETARRFISQAEQAMIERNYVLASYLADKAETLAKGLSR